LGFSLEPGESSITSGEPSVETVNVFTTATSFPPLSAKMSKSVSTRLPARSTEWSQAAEWKAGPPEKCSATR